MSDVDVKDVKQRATFDELLIFANKVREAGGGNPLDALMPAIPTDSEQCLIAKNLNFNCVVEMISRSESVEHYNQDLWAMWVGDEETQKAIADKLGLEMIYRPNLSGTGDDYGIVLPLEIGLVAEAFDEWSNIVMDGYYPSITNQRYHVIADEDIAEFQEFLPYVEASVTESYKNGVFNNRGELIL